MEIFGNSLPFVIITMLFLTWPPEMDASAISFRQHCTLECTLDVIEAMDCQPYTGECPTDTHYIGKPICGCCDACLPYLRENNVCIDGGYDVTTPLGKCAPGLKCNVDTGTCKKA